MFSKLSIKIALFALALSAGLLLGCDSKLGEDPPPAPNQEFGGAQCLSHIKPSMKAFVQGTATKVELENSWSCISGAIEKFKRYVRGRTADRYTSQELATFLEKNFLDQATGEEISPALQAEFMKVKQVFIGGTQEHLTLNEIDRLLVLIGSFRDITIKLNPYIKVLSLKWSVSEENSHESDVLFFEDANEEIQNVARLLASLIEKNGHTYKLSDFVNLMEELSGFVGEEWEFPHTINKYMPIVKKVKKALAGGDENAIAPNEWGRFTLLGSRGYIQFLRYYYFIKSVPETGTGYKLSYLSRTVEDVLSVFQDLVAEKPEGVVSRQEITELLKTLEVVWPDFKVSDELVYELMKIKHLFFGGSTESFATVDFQTARLKVSRIKFLIERFLPYYTIYGREWSPDLYEPDEAKKLFMEAQFVLDATAREAGSLFEGSYDLKDLAKLIAATEKLYPPAGESREKKLNKYLPLIVEIKKIILGGYDSYLNKNNWSALLSFASRFYTDFLYYDYFIDGESINKPQTLMDLSVLSNQTLNIIRDLLVEKKENFISRAEFGKIFVHLKKLDLIPEKLSQESLDTVVGIILNNILVSPERRIDGYVPNALVFSSIDILRQELQIWLDTELFIANTTQYWNSSRGLDQKALVELLQRNQVDPDISVGLQAGLRELLLSADTTVPITVDDKGRVPISNKQVYLYSAQSLRQLNMNRAIARVLIRSFVTDKGRISSYAGATLDEVQGVFMKLYKPLLQVGLFDEKNISFAASRFREANVFTPHSDGNTFASFAEFNDLIGMIWSGVRINTMLREELVRVCFGNRDDVKNSDSVALSCVRGAYKEAMPAAMSATPEYIRYLKTAPKDEWAIYMNNVFKAAGYIPNEKNLALLDDIALAPHVVQYIEMVLARFDKNKDGIISTSDSLRAFPSFKGVLKELAADQLKSGTIQESDLLDIFTFILRYGKPPESIKDKIKFVMSWRGKQAKWDVWAGRSQLAEILGYIADQVRKTKKTDNKLSEFFNLQLSASPGELKSQSHFEE